MTRLIHPKAFSSGSSVPREGGVALVAALMVLSILTLVGLTATFVTTTETLINHNLGSRLVNRYLAESAVEEARSRLPAMLPVADHEAVYLRRDATIDPTAGTRDTNPFFDPAYGTHGMRSARFIDSDLAGVEFAWVRVSRKTEERAGYEIDGDSTNNAEVVGYGYDSGAPALKAFQFVGSRAGHYGSPVYLLTGMAAAPSGARQMVRTEVARPPMPPLSAALYNKTAVRLLNAATIIGNDGNGRGNLAGIDTPGGVSGDTSAVRGAPAIVSPASSGHNIAALTALFQPPQSIPVQRVDPAVTVSSGIFSGTNLRLGRPGTDRRVPTFADGDLMVSGNSEGQGVLIVNGDLTVSGSFRYEGVILVNGRLRLKGYSVGSGNGISIRGAIVSHPAKGTAPSVIEGESTRIRYFSRIVAAQHQALRHARLSFRPLTRLQ
ncbi:MAG: hypothetical protein OXG96_02875 [Acidobacteria bacterium]|nr:hypothetical protein [Acidobacteriota bacterium]